MYEQKVKHAARINTVLKAVAYESLAICCRSGGSEDMMFADSRIFLISCSNAVNNFYNIGEDWLVPPLHQTCVFSSAALEPEWTGRLQRRPLLRQLDLGHGKVVQSLCQPP